MSRPPPIRMTRIVDIAVALTAESAGAPGGWSTSTRASLSTTTPAVRSATRTASATSGHARVANAISPGRAMGLTPALEEPGRVPLPPGTNVVVSHVAYQVDASVYDVWAGLSLSIGQNASVDPRAGYFESRGRGGNDYNGFSVGLDLLYGYH